MSVDNSDSEGPRQVTVSDARLQPTATNKSSNSGSSHGTQLDQNSTSQPNASKGTQSAPLHGLTCKAPLGTGDHQAANLPVFQQSTTSPVLVESTLYHANSPYKSTLIGGRENPGDNNNSTTVVKKPANNLITDCEDFMDIDESGATTAVRTISDVRNQPFLTSPAHSENRPPAATQYPNNYIMEGSNFSHVDNPSITRCCTSSPECTCTGCLEAQILQTLQLANKQLQTAIINRNNEEISELTKVIDRCFDWLKSLKTRGVDVSDVHLGCVILNFNCESPEALDTLWQRWITGQLTSELQEIFLPLFEMQYPNSKVSLVTRMCSHQYLRYRKRLTAETGKNSGRFRASIH